jgi:hypothetical protein
MRRISINTGMVKDRAVAALLEEIQKASADENLTDIAAPFIIEGTYTETRTLNVGTSTLAETQAFIATLIGDLKRGGSNRST